MPLDQHLHATRSEKLLEHHSKFTAHFAPMQSLDEPLRLFPKGPVLLKAVALFDYEATQVLMTLHF